MTVPLIIRQGIRFSLVGILNTLLTFAVFVILFRVLKINEIAANISGYVAGVINSFFWNKLWTFNSSVKNPLLLVREISSFVLVFLFSLALQMVLFKCLLARGVTAEFSEIPAMILYTVVNFTGNRFLTFKKYKNL
jgi:putative flippase GtrA